MSTKPELKAKGDEGEADLNEWFKKNGLCYIYVAQDQKTFSSLFPGSVKRPDFLVLIESIGLIAVDAKNHELKGDCYTLQLEKELLRVLTFERLFRIPVWYAYRRTVDGVTTWYWISALKALEVGTQRKNGKTKEVFLAIHTNNFAKITSSEDMGLLYTQRHKDTSKLNQHHH